MNLAHLYCDQIILLSSSFHDKGSRSNVVTFPDKTSLEIWLTRNGIDISAWGTGSSKTLTDLWHELNCGEIILHEYPPLRVVNVVQVIIRRNDRILVETEQVLRNGRKRRRNQPPAEKFKPGETYQDAAKRCLQEELGIDARLIKIRPETHRQIKTYSHSFSYPGLPSLYTVNIVEANVQELPLADFWRDNQSFTNGDPVRKHRWGWREEAVLMEH